MRKLPVFLLALFVALTSIGCDSNEDDPTDAEIFIGTWTVVEVRDSEGDKTSVFDEGVNNFSATLNSDNTYSLIVDFLDPERTDIPLTGTYTIEPGDVLILRANLGAGELLLPFQYDIESENRINLSISESFVEAIFGTEEGTYVGDVTFRIARQ
jgi:hypothetical protein